MKILAFLVLAAGTAFAQVPSAAEQQKTIMHDYRAENAQITATGWQYPISPTQTFSIPIADPTWSKVNYTLPPLHLEPADIAQLHGSQADLARQFAALWTKQWAAMKATGQAEGQQRVNMVVAAGKIAQGPNASAQDIQNRTVAEKNLQKLMNFAHDEKSAVLLLVAALQAAK